jgi:riboflavin kinase, archaea type
MKITGNVVRGVGESASFMAIPWVDKQMREKLRFQPYEGTLNISVKDPEIQRSLKAHGGDRLCSESAGFCDALIFRGTIAGKYECGIVLPLVPNYDACLIEILAPVHLKDALGLKDGDEVTLELSL